MTNRIDLNNVLSSTNRDTEQQRSIFALLNLGILESLATGSLSATDAVSLFFHADNCLFVQHELRDRIAEQIMSHGVQLPDLFLVLPPQKAQRELTAMRTLCNSLSAEEMVAT